MLAFVQPTSHHANQRKMFRRGLGPQRIASHDDLIASEVAKLTQDLQTFQGNPIPIIQRCDILQRPDVLPSYEYHP
jgi:cytochrome P450